MTTPLVQKLEKFVRFNASEKDTLNALSQLHVHKYATNEDIISEGDRPTDVNLILSGWACRYKLLEDGRSQIVSFFMPGDLCDLNLFILREMDHSIRAVTPVELVRIPRQRLVSITENDPRVAQALWWETLVTQSVLREWLLNIGQRTALERVAHLLCELFLRLRAVELTEGQSCDLPLTQAVVGEATGLSIVHVNRTLMELRRKNLIVWEAGRLTIPDLAALQDLALFDRNYLHLEHEGASMDAIGR